MADTKVSIQCPEDIDETNEISANNETRQSQTQVQIVRMNSRHLDYKRRCSLFKKMLIVYVTGCVLFFTISTCTIELLLRTNE